ncbi:MAG TPA: PDZ domain-containing protein [Negativicutes bacterium]|nr:PDZ domain-containing protein [Negativicutes bacterium]
MTLAVISILLALPGTCAAVELGSQQMIYQNVWYRPAFQPSAEAAMGTIRNLGASKVFSGWNGYEDILEVNVDQYGLRVRGVFNQVKTQGQWVPSYGGTWVGGKYIPYNGGSYQTHQTQNQLEERSVVEFPKVGMVDLQYYPNIDREYKWGVAVTYADGSGMVAFRTGNQQTAHNLANAIATLATAAGARLYTPSGAYFLVNAADNDKQRKQMKWTAESGVFITDVLAGSPAAGAGLRPKDVIVEANGTEVKDLKQWRETVQTALGDNPDAKFELKVFRDGNLADVSLTVPNFNYGRPAGTQGGQAAATAAKKPALGVDVLPLAAEEAKAAGLTGGLRIVSVAPDGLAAKSQLKANDILLEVNGKPVPDTAALKQILAGEAPRQFKVLRDGAMLVLDAAQSF